MIVIFISVLILKHEKVGKIFKKASTKNKIILQS